METPEVSDKVKMQVGALKFLYEIELLDDPNLLNNLKLNILAVSKRIRETEILSLHRFERKEMLIFIDLTWWGRKFESERILSDVEGVISKLLPNFKLRVTQDKKILDAAVKNVHDFFEPKKKKEKTA